MPVEPIATTEAPKNGLQTTEFWLALLTAIAGLAGQASQMIDAPWGAILAMVSTVAYTIARTFLKTNAPVPIQ